MLSSISAKENQRVGSNSSEVVPEDQVENEALNGVVEADLRPSQTMIEDEEVDINGDDDEIANVMALQPIKDRLQDILLSSLDKKCLTSLGKKLDVDRPVGLGRNYLELASRLFPEKSNDSLHSDLRNIPHPTSFLIQKFCKEKGQQATVFTLVEALFGMRRLDAIQDILHAFEKKGIEGKQKRSGFKASNLLTIMRKRLTKNPDTVSNLSVFTTTSSESSCSLEDVSYHVVGNYQCSPKPNYQARENSFSGLREKVKQPDSDTIFVVSASDEIQLCIMLVQWLRKKGFDATCIETGRVEYGSHPYQYVERLYKDASTIIIVCSPKFKEVVSDQVNATHFNDNDLAIRTVYYSLCQDFFESGGHNGKYIPLIKPGTSRSCVVGPLNWTVTTVFQEHDKDNREALIRRLCKQERYTLGPIGPKPKIKPKLITGNLTDLRK